MKPENYSKLFAYMTYENTLVARLSLETGMRIGDVLKLRPDDLDGRTIRFVSEKTGKAGKATITRDLAGRLRQIAGDKYIFSKRGKPGEHRTRQAVWRDVKQAAQKLREAGLIGDENITPHSARKTFAVTDTERHGIQHTQRALQHKYKDTTRIYAYSNKHLQEMTDNYVLKVLIDRIAHVNDRLDELFELIGKIDTEL